MIINEFLPNPVGKDADGEWIKLFNDGKEAVDLFGWKIKDASGKIFVFKNIKIAPAETLKLDYQTTKISLNNNGETLFLYDRNGDLIDKIEYGGTAAEGKIFTRQNLFGQNDLLAAEIINPLLNNQTVNVSQKFNFTDLFIGISLALILASLFIFWKLDLLSE